MKNSLFKKLLTPVFIQTLPFIIFSIVKLTLQKQKTLPQKNKSLLLPLFCLQWFLFLSHNNAYSNSCTNTIKPNNEKTTICFFSLNNEKEKTKLNEQIEEVKGKHNIEVKEFFPAKQVEKEVSTQERFENMVNSEECDSLIISGHNVGSFTGRHTNKLDSNKKLLNLDFLENLSCQATCQPWFDNVKNLFLMGSKTTLAELAKGERIDNTIITLNEKYKNEHVDLWQDISLAYSSTLDKTNPSNIRYLKMFPSSTLFGWKEQAPGITTRSEHNLPQFFKALLEGYKLPPSTTEKGKYTNITAPQLAHFINLMNQPNQGCNRAIAWVNHWSKSTPTACYNTDNGKEELKKYQKQGCALVNATGNKQKQDAVNDILKKPQSIKYNLNRLIALAKEKKQEANPLLWETLKQNESLKKTIEKELDSPTSSIARKVDYAYIYQKLYGKTNTYKSSLTDLAYRVSGLYEIKIEDLNALKQQDKKIKSTEFYAKRATLAHLFRTINRIENDDAMEKMRRNDIKHFWQE